MAKKIVAKNRRRPSKKNDNLGADHSQEIKRLRRILGQIEGIGRMIEQKRYCPDILQQLKASRAALRALEIRITETHLRGCVRQAMTTRDSSAISGKIEELVKMMKQ